MNFIKLIYIFCFLILPLIGLSQVDTTVIHNGTEGEVFHAKTKDSAGVKKPVMRLNEFDGPLTTLKFDGGFLYEYAGFVQDDVSKEQVTAESNFKVRDARFIMSGKFKIKREITWKVGLMYDGEAKSWYTRESGVMINLPEISGRIFIGRTKEGYSLSKVMNGYSGWNMERLAAIDVIPILADGIKYMGYFPKARLVLNLGAFADWTSKEQSFSTYQYQFISRLALLPIYSGVDKPVLHIGANYRYGKVKDDNIRVRSKPEVSGGPFYVDSETMSADYSNSIGGEVYFRSQKFLIGTEFHAHIMHSPENDNPVFAGGEAFVAYVFTGEIRPYYTASGIFGFVRVRNSIFDGGLGAWEGIIRFTNLDLDDGAISGGNFWRVTPTLNWYMSNNIRLVLSYGYCVLDRYELEGASNIFQSRILFML